jgi:hypothetical protein
LSAIGDEEFDKTQQICGFHSEETGQIDPTHTEETKGLAETLRVIKLYIYT